MKIFKSMLVLLAATCSLNTFAQTPNINLNAVKEYEVTPTDYGLITEDISIETADGVKLFGWHISPDPKSFKDSKKAVVLAPDGIGNMSNSLQYASNWLAMGYHVFCFDYRGYGKSADFTINTKFYIYQQFATDLDAAIEFVKKYHASWSIDLFGWGIGGGLAVGVGANNIKVHRIVADGAYLSLATVEQRFKDKTGGKILMPLGYDKGLIEPLFALQDHGDHLRGILLIVGQNGTYVTPDDMKQLQDEKKKIVSIYIVKGVDNDKNLSSNPDEYFKQIGDFMKGD